MWHGHMAVTICALVDHIMTDLNTVIGFVAVVAVTAYMVRGLQLVLGSSKRAVIERAEEMGAENDDIPLADISSTRRTSESIPTDSAANSIFPGNSEPAKDLAADLTAPPKAQDPSSVRSTGNSLISEITPPPTPAPPTQSPEPLTRAQRWATFINLHLDRLTYLVLFLFVGIPIYYSTGYAMPAQLTFNILAFFAALSLPARYRQYLHPVLISSGITILGIWILGLIRGDSLHTVLEAYKTDTKYLQLWHGEKNLPKPGAGDIFSSILDASIVSLALPMFQYRHELRQHFFAIVIPNITLSVASLFGYPAVCYAIGISATRSLAFSSRSLTLALATPAVSNLGGDLNTAAALCIMSGIMGVLIGQRLLAWLRIPEGMCNERYRIYDIILTLSLRRLYH
jgi:putative effector of murein hydrolase